MFTTPENWLQRFKAAGGSGRFNHDLIWPNETVEHLHEAKVILSEIRGAENQREYQQVLAHLKTIQPATAHWIQF